MTHPCADCAAPIQPRSTRCKACFMAHIGKDPAVRAKKAASLRRYSSDPANKAVIRDRSRAAALTRWSNSAYAEKARKRFVEVAQPLSLTDPRAKDWRRKSAAVTADKRMAWCPLDRRDEYRRLVKNGMKAVAARRQILASLSPFERQERALALGAALIANVRVAIR